MYSFDLHNDTYNAITLWLDILKEYDDNFLRSCIANYKTRRIHQQTASKTSNLPKSEIVTSVYAIAEDLRQNQDNPDEDSIIQLKIDLQAEDLKVLMEQQQSSIITLSKGLENLSEKINIFTDNEDNLIDFFK